MFASHPIPEPQKPVTETLKKFDKPGTMAFIEKEAIVTALKFHNGNRTHTARRLNIGIRTLQRKLKTYGMSDYRISPGNPNLHNGVGVHSAHRS